MSSLLNHQKQGAREWADRYHNGIPSSTSFVGRGRGLGDGRWKMGDEKRSAGTGRRRVAVVEQAGFDQLWLAEPAAQTATVPRRIPGTLVQSATPPCCVKVVLMQTATALSGGINRVLQSAPAPRSIPTPLMQPARPACGVNVVFMQPAPPHRSIRAWKKLQVT